MLRKDFFIIFTLNKTKMEKKSKTTFTVSILCPVAQKHIWVVSNHWGGWIFNERESMAWIFNDHIDATECVEYFKRLGYEEASIHQKTIETTTFNLKQEIQ
jgi:hypothetical protein